MEAINPTIAYFSAEIGISASLPTYSGGLGVLAGDHIKAAADVGLPMVGITLLYKEGYFKQKVNERGEQTETYPRFDPETKLKQLPDKFILRLRERDVWVEAYEYSYKGENGHTIPIYFLDTDNNNIIVANSKSGWFIKSEALLWPVINLEMINKFFIVQSVSKLYLISM